MEQARQELISQVTKSAAKTLETIRGLSLPCLTISSIIITHNSRCICFLGFFFNKARHVFSRTDETSAGIVCDSRYTLNTQDILIKYEIGIYVSLDLQSCFVCGCNQ